MPRPRGGAFPGQDRKSPPSPWLLRTQSGLQRCLHDAHTTRASAPGGLHRGPETTPTGGTAYGHPEHEPDYVQVRIILWTKAEHGSTRGSPGSEPTGIDRLVSPYLDPHLPGTPDHPDPGDLDLVPVEHLVWEPSKMNWL